MCVVSRLSRQRFTALFAILAVLGFGLLPSEHVHVARTHDGHHSDFVHRHFEPHHRTATQTTADHPEDDEAVRWLTASFTNPGSAGHVAADSQLAVDDLPIWRPQQTFRGRIEALFVSVHDPPWAIAIGLRAPPACLL